MTRMAVRTRGSIRVNAFNPHSSSMTLVLDKPRLTDKKTEAWRAEVICPELPRNRGHGRAGYRACALKCDLGCVVRNPHFPWSGADTIKGRDWSERCCFGPPCHCGANRSRKGQLKPPSEATPRSPGSCLPVSLCGQRSQRGSHGWGGGGLVGGGKEDVVAAGSV